MSSTPISIKESYANKHILLAGASGFLGKVWLAMALQMLPEIARIYVLIRPGIHISARRRFENILNTSPVFKWLHETYGPELSSFIINRVEVIEGDLAESNLGIDKDTAFRLKRNIDLVVNCAGQVDFMPDLRKALAANVDAAQRLMEFVKRCDHAALLHVSTCFVVGNQQGYIPETLDSNPAIARQDFDPLIELADARNAAQYIFEAQKSEKVQEKLQRDLEQYLSRRENSRNGRQERFKKAFTRRWLREHLRNEMVQEGKRRAKHWDWQNTYTYSKGIAERLIRDNAQDLPYTIVRPSIIESSLTFPFPGWNQGFNASAPLAYLLGTWFHMLPAKSDIPFDIVPVDMVCRALTVIGAALLKGRHAPVYHIGTSHRNRFTLGRACELTGLGHRRHLREKGATTTKRVLLSRWDTKVVSPDHLLSAKNLRRATHEFSELIEDLPTLFRKRSHKLSNRLKKAEKQLSEIQDMLEAFKPFIHDNFQVFTCDAIEAHPPLEPEFLFTPEKLDWRKYWIEVHMEGLRRWVFPQFEGKSREVYESEYPVSISDDKTNVTYMDDHKRQQMII